MKRVQLFLQTLIGVSISQVALAQVPIDGFFPLVGITLTDEFDDDFNFFPTASDGVSGNQLGPNGTPTYDVALLDTGAGFSLLTDATFDNFALGSASPGESDGYRGTEFVTIGGATGQLLAPINDPLGLYASGLQDRSGAGAVLTMNNALLQGQTNTATIKFPPESELPNIVGLPFASQYATRIRNDAPQVFELDGRTIRSPSIDFLPLGSGGGEIIRKAPLNLNPGASFAQPPAYLPNIINFDIQKPQENPSTPTLVQGGLFLNVQAENDGGDLGGTTEFFFDTGASVTVVSELNALNLGFDVLTDQPEFTISVVGSGGVLADIPGFFVEEFTIVALGGSITATNVPVIVLDVADPSDPGNVVEGIVGTNLLSGRNIVIDPNPSLGGGGESAGVYISDEVTSDFVWQSAGAQAMWSSPSSWDASATPDYLSKTRLKPVSSIDQSAVVAGTQFAWDVVIGGGGPGETMTVQISSGAELSVFSGVTIEERGVVELQNGTLDAQYVDIRGGKLTGAGEVRTGSGPIVGQVEALSGTISPGDGVGRLSIDGRISTGAGAVFEFELGGVIPETEYDQLAVSGTVALAGTLDVSLVDIGAGLFDPEVGDIFTILTSTDGIGGEFSSANLPAGFTWGIDYQQGSVILQVLMPGDFNGDNVVNSADFTVWRDGYGRFYTSNDYLMWKANFGATAPAAATGAPEPYGLAVVALAPGFLRRSRRAGIWG